ncbi:hypothetical protein Tco_1555403, partial [Tanacetum coccineum]
IRSDLLFDDADGIDSLPNQAIFDAIQLMGYEGDLTLNNVPVPLDHFPINALTNKVFSFMVKKGKHFSGDVTPLCESMLVQPTEDEGEASKRQSEIQPTPSPPYPSADHLETQPDPSPRPSPTIPIHDSIPEGSSGNHGGQSSSDRSLSRNEDGLTLQRKKSLKTMWMQKESVSKQGRKLAKAEPTIRGGQAKAKPTVHKDPTFDDLDDIVDDAMDYMESEDAQDEGRTSFVVLKEKESTQKGVSTEVEVSAVKPNESIDKSKVSTDKPEVSTAKPKDLEVSTDKLDEGTAEPKDGNSDESTAPTTVFRDDETITEFLVSMSQNKAKQKGVEIKDTEDSDRPRATSTRLVLTLKPLPKIDPKDKGKKVLEEEAKSDAESEGVDEAERKIKADRLLAARLQEEERETFTIKERAKFLYDTIAAQRRFLAQQRAAAIKSRPLTRTQLRNQMMTYLKPVGGKKHADLKNKNFKEIQVLYKKAKRSDKDFIAIGFAEDERQIKEMNEESKDPKKKRVINETPREEDTTKVPAEREVTKHDSEIMETKSFVSKLHKVSSLDGDYLVDYKVNGHFRAFNYLMGGDLKIMMESSTEENDQELKDGRVIYMLVERRYTLSKELLQRMLDLGLEVEEESTAALHLGRKIDDIDKDADVTLVDETQGRYGDDLVFHTTILEGEEVFAGQDVVEKEVSTADLVTTAGEVVTTASVEVSAATTITTTAITKVDLTLAQALAELRSAKPKVTDKGKAKMFESEKPLKKIKQIRINEELAFKLQAEEEEQARLVREKAEKV